MKVKVGIIGSSERAEARAQVLEAAEGARLAARLPEVTAADMFDYQGAVLDAVLVTGPVEQRERLACAAVKQGMHVFLEWPPAASVRACKRIAELAGEAGVEVGVSRPLRFHPGLQKLPTLGAVELVSLELSPASPTRWPDPLADALDLCCAAAGAGGVRRLDAQATHGPGAQVRSLAFAMRFHSGTYAHGTLRSPEAWTPEPDREARPETFYMAGSSFEVQANLKPPAAWIRKEGETGFSPIAGEAAGLLAFETKAFLKAVAGDRPAPVSILDALRTLRVVERLLQQLR